MAGGGYNVFAGKDASVALAKMNFALDLMDTNKYHWSKNLNENEMKILDNWVDFYTKRYKVVAKIKYDDIHKNK